MERQLKQLNAFLKPETKLHEVLPSDIRQVIVGEEQEWSPSVDHEDPEPPHIKEEQEEVWIKQEGEQPEELEETGFTPVPVKSEDEEKPQSSHLHQTHTVDHKEDCGGSEPARSSGPDGQDTEDKTEDSSETEISGDDLEGTREHQSCLNVVKKKKTTVVDLNCNAVERSFSCSVCDQRFGRKPHLNAHMRIHTGEKPFSCTFCSKKFSQKGNSISHMRLHTGEKPFSCCVCKKSFRYSGDVSRHMRIHTGKKKNTWNLSDTIISNTRPEPISMFDPDIFIKPVTDDGTDAESKPTDDSCKETRKEESDTDPQKTDPVSLSEVTCTTEKESFSCSECGRTFCRKDHLMSHMRRHTGEKPFSCSVCEKRFSCSGNILAHMRIHTGEKPFACSICGKSFSQKGTLHLHVKIHTGEKPYSCPFCDKRFAHKRRMTLHMSVHTEEKRFTCTVCDKRFTWYTQLKTHKCISESLQSRQCQNQKKEPFCCTECGKQFSLKGNLKTHMRIHTGEKPFLCLVCGKSFKQNVHLTEHMTIHTGEKLYKCNICGKGFNKKLLVRKHTCV